jgi:hypothetical protein
MDVPSLTNMMAKIIQVIWAELFEPLWSTWNDILHRMANHLTALEHDRLGDLLRWFFLNRQDVLSSDDQFLITYNLDDIDHIPLMS